MAGACQAMADGNKQIEPWAKPCNLKSFNTLEPRLAVVCEKECFPLHSFLSQPKTTIILWVVLYIIDEHVLKLSRSEWFNKVWKNVNCDIDWLAGRCHFWLNVKMKVSYFSASASHAVNNSNMTEWSPIWSVLYEWLTKSDECAAGVWFV